MKRFMSLFMLLVVLLLCVSPANASAATVTGKNKSSTTFTMTATTKNAYFVLVSATGVANVAQHNFFGKFTRNANEITHGFYKVTVKGNGFNNTAIWAPSATTNKKGILTCREAQFKVPRAGKYTVTESPLSNRDAAKYWKMDSINSWVCYASWMATITSGCSLK